MAGASTYWWDRKVTGMPAINAAKTHCKHGWRRCRTCQLASTLRTKARRKVAA